MSTPSADIAVIGLAVMGQNLILNMADHGFTVVAYNRTVSKVDEFLSGAAKGFSVVGAASIPEMAALLKRPRRVMLMVKAGEAVDSTIEAVLPHLEAGDIVIDGGNSRFDDTERRQAALAERGILFIGAGISGGEEGARNGPSIMPGGNEAAWPAVQPIFEAIAAKTDRGESCCGWVGPGGSGHFVKMVHNGIEYGDMELIAEAWQLLRHGSGVDDARMAGIFGEWNKGLLSSYLIEITADILSRKEGQTLLVDRILDAAGQKGTGKWTGIEALDRGVPLTLITEAVFARSLSALKDERTAASGILSPAVPDGKAVSVGDVHDALLASKIVSYAQGFALLRSALPRSREASWQPDYGAIALLWRGGCIIRSGFLEKIRDAFERNPDLPNLLIDPWFSELLSRLQPGWRRAAAQGMLSGIALPAITSALSWFDGYRTASGGASLIQAQRDYFGAHTYERTDGPRGEFFHTDWTESGGTARSGTYTA